MSFKSLMAPGAHPKQLATAVVFVQVEVTKDVFLRM